MIAIDTNVLARIFVDDSHIEQTNQARKLAQKAKKVFVSQVVQVELVWVLKKAFGLDKTQILLILNELYDNDAFVLQRDDVFQAALALYTTNAVGFSDCLITVEANEIPLYTFDRKFARMKKVILIP